MAVGKYIYIYTCIYIFIIFMQNNINQVWKTSRKRSAAVSHLLPSTYKLVLYLTKTKLYNTNCYWRKGCCHHLEVLWCTSQLLFAKSYFLGNYSPERGYKLKAPLEKSTLCGTVVQTWGPACLPQGLSFDLRFTDCWRSLSMHVPMLPGYSAEQ